MNTVGAPGGFITNTAGIGMDISGSTGIAYLQHDTFITVAGPDQLSTINLATGALTTIGTFGGTDMLDIAILVTVPEPTSLGLLAVGATALLRRRK